MGHKQVQLVSERLIDVEMVGLVRWVNSHDYVAVLSHCEGYDTVQECIEMDQDWKGHEDQVNETVIRPHIVIGSISQGSLHPILNQMYEYGKLRCDTKDDDIVVVFEFNSKNSLREFNKTISTL